jgi:Tfp pilus assembly protein FimT
MLGLTQIARRAGRERGFTAFELLFVVTLVATMSGVSVPPVLRALDDYRAAAATRYVATRLQRMRMEAVLRSADVGAKFVLVGNQYTFRNYIDGIATGSPLPTSRTASIVLWAAWNG